MNLNKLIEICSYKTTEPFRKLGNYQATKYGDLIHIDRGSSILAVAHLDYVLWSKPKIIGEKIYCPQLDDRLGVWVLLDLLPSLGLEFDILLTDSEEIGKSTAQFFKPDRDYQWMFEFDRRGKDAVMYEYETWELTEKLEGCGFEVGFGSFSDICYLNSLGVAGFNFGVGYHGEHTNNCFANLADTFEQALKFRRFMRKYEDETFVFENKPQSRYGDWDSRDWDDWRYDSLGWSIVQSEDDWRYTPKAATPTVTTPKAATPKAATPTVTTPKAATPKAATPKAATPTVTTPKAATPKAATPKAATPTVTTPKAATPTVTTPKAATPKAATPTVTTPKAATPKAATPTVTTPKAATPKAATPTVTTPKAATPTVTTPKAATPKAATPKAATPTVTTPDRWVTWHGNGDCPVLDGVTTIVKFHSGAESQPTNKPGSFRWSWNGNGGDIIAYRTLGREKKTVVYNGKNSKKT